MASKDAKDCLDPRSQPRSVLGPQAERLENHQTLLAGNDPLDRPYRGLPYRPVSCRSMNRGAILMIRGCHLQILIPQPLFHHHKRSILSSKTLLPTCIPPISNQQSTWAVKAETAARPSPSRWASLDPPATRTTDEPEQAPKKEKKELDEEDKAFLEKKRAGKSGSDPAV